MGESTDKKSVGKGGLFDYRNDPEIMKGFHDYIEEQKKIPSTGYTPGEFSLDFCDLDDEESLAAMHALIQDPTKIAQILREVPYKK